jgi:hypothetical protein
MYWYIIPIFQIEKESGGFAYVPGVGDPLAEYQGGSYTIHAADPKGAPTTALLGTSLEFPATPVAWTPKTLAEAQAHFEAVMGRAPRALEVF